MSPGDVLAGGFVPSPPGAPGMPGDCGTEEAAEVSLFPTGTALLLLPSFGVPFSGRFINVPVAVLLFRRWKMAVMGGWFLCCLLNKELDTGFRQPVLKALKALAVLEPPAGEYLPVYTAGNAAGLPAEFAPYFALLSPQPAYPAYMRVFGRQW